MLQKKIEKVLLKQINYEAYSSYLYISMASWAEVNGFNGVAQWFYIQSEEERQHMLKFIKYVNEREGKTILTEIKTPPSEFNNVKEVFEKVLEHEKLVSKLINNIFSICMDTHDYTTQNWLQWFVNEQIEEEAIVKIILDKLRMIDENNLYLFDRDILDFRTNITNKHNK